jgi:formylmethanofuran dehydrogenase subunit D
MINLRYKFHSNYDSISHLLDGKDPRIHKVSEEEYDDAYDQAVIALSEFYLVCDDRGQSITGAPIHMNPYFDAWSNISIVIAERACTVDVLHALVKVLARLNQDWFFTLDVDTVGRGGCWVVIEADGTIHAHAVKANYHVLQGMGFPKMAYWENVAFGVASAVNQFFSRRKFKKMMAAIRETRNEEPEDLIEKLLRETKKNE